MGMESNRATRDDYYGTLGMRTLMASRRLKLRLEDTYDRLEQTRNTMVSGFEELGDALEAVDAYREVEK